MSQPDSAPKKSESPVCREKLTSAAVGTSQPVRRYCGGTLPRAVTDRFPLSEWRRPLTLELEKSDSLGTRETGES
jgi:hypothetical protein